MAVGEDETQDARAAVLAWIAAEQEEALSTGSRSAGGRDGGPRIQGLDRLCRAAARALPVSGAGVSVRTETGQQAVAGASDALSVELEDLQFTLGEGPCIDAFSARRPVLVPTLDEAMSRWPAYAREAHRRGVCAVFTFPIQAGAIRLGVLDLYRSRTGGLGAVALERAFAFADVALDVILDEQRRAGTEALASVVYDAGDRAELYQAQGMVMVQLGVDLVEAMVRLRAYAYTRDRTLNEVARDVVAGRLRIEDDGPPRGT